MIEHLMRSFARGTKVVLSIILTVKVREAHFCSFIGNHAYER